MTGFFRFLGWVLGNLNATEDMDPKAHNSWRRFIGATVSIILLAGVAGFCWAQGWVPGVSGVALAADLTTLTKKVEDNKRDSDTKQDRLALLIVKGAIKTTLIDRCTAIHRKNQAALTAANSTLDDLVEQYRDLKKDTPPIPACDVVLIDDRPPQ